MSSVVDAYDIVHSIWKASNRKSLLSLSPTLQDLPWASASWSNNLAMLDASPHFQKTLLPAFQAWEDYIRESNLMRPWHVWLKIRADTEEPPSDASKNTATFIQQQCCMIMLYRIFDGACVERFGWSDKLIPRVPYTTQESSELHIVMPTYLQDWGKVLEDFSRIADSIVIKSSTVIKESEDTAVDLARIMDNIETTEKKLKSPVKRLLRNVHSITVHLAHLIGYDFLALNDGIPVLPDWYRYQSTKNDDRNHTLDWHFRYNLQVVALISPIFAAVSDSHLESRITKWRRPVLMEYSRRLGNDKPKIVQEIELVFWKMLLRIAAHEIGVGEAIKELADGLPMETIRALSLAERQWFLLAPVELLKGGFKRKRMNEDEMTGETMMLSRSSLSYQNFMQSGCFQFIRLQTSWTSPPPTSGLSIPDADVELELSRVQCGIPVHTLAGLKTQYFFLAQESAASYLDQWLEAVISRLDGKGPFYLDPSRTAESSFVLESYNLMSDRKLLNRALSKRNVILVDAPENCQTFGRASLSQFYPVKSKIPILDHLYYPPKKCSGTLNDILAASDIDDGAVLSTERLDLPEGFISPFGISSDIAAWRATKGRLFCPADEAVSISHIRGAFASLKGAFCGTQIAYDGFGIVVKVECGAVWFIVGAPIKKDTGFGVNDYREGNFTVHAPDCTKWVYEAVVLTSGTQLILQPNTPFATVTLEHAVYTVDHFYSTSNLVQTLAGLIHMLCSPHMAKSASISSSCALLQRYTICLHAAFVLHDIDESDPVCEHLPDVTTSEGASNFLAACVIAINLDIFDWSSYKLRNGSHSGLDRYYYVRELAYELLEWFFFHHTLKENLPVQPRASRKRPRFVGKPTTSATPWTLDSVLKADGRLIASVMRLIRLESERDDNDHHLNADILSAIVNQVFPKNHERGGAVIRHEYQEALSEETDAEPLDFVRRDWVVSTVIDPQFSSFQPQGVVSYTQATE